MNKLIDRLKRYRARDFVYFLTPPIFYKFFSMIGSSNNNRPKLVDESNFSHELSMLEEKGMDYFINEDVIKIFCNKSRKQLLESSYTEIDNDKKPYLDKLDKNGYVIVKNIFESDTLNKINESLSKIIDQEVDHLKDLRRNSKSLLISDAPTRNVEVKMCT